MRNLLKQIGNVTWEDSSNSGILLSLNCDDYVENYLIPKKYLLAFKNHFPEFNPAIKDKTIALDKAIINPELSKEEILVYWEALKSTIEEFKKKVDSMK